MDTSSVPTTNATDTVARNTTGDPCRILLIELANLLGLVLTHSRSTRGARATAVIFDQIIRRLQILDRMPGHTGAIIVRRILPTGQEKADKPDYYLTFGNENFCRSNALPRSGQSGKSSHRQIATLDQAFGAFQEQGIVSLFLQIPGISTDKIDQLRLSLNILARFRPAAENNSSITFHYFGRAMTIPLIRDSNGKPDPNLTLVAGLNGLSAINMREIIKQAVSFCKLATTEVEDECSSDNYSKIFSVRGLRSQLIQPPVEINTLPSFQEAGAQDNALTCNVSADGDVTSEIEAADTLTSETVGKTAEVQLSSSTPLLLENIHLSIDDLGLSAEICDQQTLESVLIFESQPLDVENLGRHLALINRIMHTLVEGNETERLLDLLNARLEKLPEDALTQMEMQRQGLKIEFNGRKAIVGMVHPRLVELITLIKEKRAAKEKIDTCRDCADIILKNPSSNPFTDRLGFHDNEADRLLACFRQSSDHPHGFGFTPFLECLGELHQHETAVFEMLWCLFRNTADDVERQAYHIALPMIVQELKDATSALAFLMADLFRRPTELSSCDLNAFALATLMLRTHYKERVVDISHTPEEVLAVRKSLKRQTLDQASWRLYSDRAAVLLKFKMIRDALRDAMAGITASDESYDSRFQLLLAMEREGLIFMALAGGPTALTVFREALAYYGNPRAEIYRGGATTTCMYALVAHLQIILRGMARLGTPEDLDSLKMVEQSASRLMALDADPGYARRVKKALQWVAPAIRAIQVQLQ